MEKAMEVLMLLCLYGAVWTILCRFANERSVHKNRDRFTVITIGAGFVFGAIGEAVVPPSEWSFALYVIGAWLSYTAVAASVVREGASV